MFTGIIEDIGTVRSKTAARLSLTTKLDGIKTGDSVAVNGVCLTATAITAEGGRFLIDFDYSPETASRTNLSELAAGDHVNMERALKIGDRLGGHFLTGHVEATGRLLSAEKQGEFVVLSFSFPEGFDRYLVDKGSIGIDGISLTLVSPSENTFSAAVIPHTVQQTCLQYRRPGDTVNLEPDLIAKYVENMLSKKQAKKQLTVDLLKENGFY